jgi:hypothetical protein
MADANIFPNDGKIPAARVRAVTPSDSQDLPLDGCRGLYVGGGGDVRLIAAGDAAAVTFANVADGSVLPVQAARVLSTGTTATNIVALY